MERGPRSAGQPPRWERCINHRGGAVADFFREYLVEEHRRVLLIAGAGFDPRTLVVPRLLSEAIGNRLEAAFLREERPNPEPRLLSEASAQLQELQRLVPSSEVVDLPVFERDGAVALGRHTVNAFARRDLSRFTDIMVDLSALSIGCSFPLMRLVLQYLEAQRGSEVGQNLHALVTSSPTTDDRIKARPSDKVGPVHGFQGRLDIDETAHAARLWIPQLRFGRTGALEQLHRFVKPDDVVPVLPFPAADPRLGDRLIEHYMEEFDGAWSVDARSIIYADERSPLDLYRTVLRIHDGRHRVFERTGGNLLVLSPIGSKVLGLGAMMAAMERDFPVVYVEALSFECELDADGPSGYTEADLVHVWLFGEAYPAVRT